MTPPLFLRALALITPFSALQPLLAAPAPPAITVTKDDGVPAATRKAGNTTMTYTNTIANGSGSTADAAGVQFSDPNVANTTQVPGTLNVTPLALDDIYSSTVIANTTVDTSISGFNVLANDYFGYAADTALNAASSSVTVTVASQPLHGSVAFNSGGNKGTFVYSPTPGYTGPDSFTYTLSNGVSGSDAASVTGTVSLTVGGPVIWFVNPNLATTGIGSLASPFKTLAEAATAIGTSTGQRIFLYSSSTPQSGSVTLRSGGWLVGQAAVGTSFDSLMSVTYPGDTTTPRPSINNASKPSITHSAGNTIVLGEGNSIFGVAIANTGGGVAVSGSGINSATIGNAVTSDVSIGSSGSSSGAVSLSGGNGAVNINAPITTTAGKSVSISNRTGSTVTFTRAINDTGTGIALATNTGASIAFSGTITASTGTSAAFSATGGGTVTTTDTNSTLATTTGTSLNVSGTSIGAAGLKFKSISANGAATGIILSNTGTSGGLTVTGDGTNNASGGTIQNTTNDGIQITNAQNVSLTSMSIQNTAHNGITGQGVTNFSFINGTINNSGTGAAPQASNIAFNGNVGTSPHTPVSGVAYISGALTVTGSTLNNSYYHGVTVRQDTGTITNLNISNNSFTSSTNAANSNGSAIDVDPTGSATSHASITTGTINNNTINNFPSGAGIQVLGGNATAGASGQQVAVGTPNTANKLVISGNAINGGATFMGTNAIAFQVNGYSVANIEILNNGTVGSPLQNFKGNAIVCGATGFADVHAKIHDNVANCSANIVASPGISIGTDNTFANTDTPHLTISVLRNSITNSDGNGILATSRTASGTLDIRIDNNNIGAPKSGVRPGIRVDSGNSSSGTVTGDTVHLEISGNTSAGSGGSPGIGLRKQGTVSNVNTFGIEGMAATSTPNVEAYVNGLNPAGGGTLLISATSGFTNSGAVPLPLLFAQGGVEKSQDTAQPVADSIPPAQIAMPVAGPVEDETPSTTASQPAVPAALTQEQLIAAVAESRARWEATGLTKEQIARLQAMRFELASLAGLHLGEAHAEVVRVDDRAGGSGWFTDVSPESDVLFSRTTAQAPLYTTPSQAPAGRLDLLTTILHEMGHVLGLPDTYRQEDRGSIMYGHLTKGERRLPVTNQARDAVPLTNSDIHFLTQAVTIPTLPIGKKVVITYDVTINDSSTWGPATQLSSQATVSGSNFTNISSDDPNVAGAADPTITLLQLPPTTVSSLNRSGASSTNATSVSWRVTFANAVYGVTSANFALANTGLTGPSITAVTAVTSLPATQWDITASTGTGDGSLGLNLVNDTGMTFTVTNAPFVGQVYAVDKTPPPAPVTLAPANGSSTNNAVPTYSGNAEANSVVTVFVDGTSIGTTSADGGGAWSKVQPTSLSESSHTVKSTATDAAGNTSVNSNTNSFTVDLTAPTVSMTSATGNPATNAAIPVTVTFSEPVTGFTSTSVTPGNATVQNFSGSGTSYTFNLLPTGPGVTASADIAASVAQDAAGNNNTAAAPFSRNIVDAVSIAATTATTVEGGANGLYTFTRGASTGDLTVSFQLDPSSTATAGTDFTLTSSGTLTFDTGTGAGTIVIPNGQTSASVTLTALIETPNPAEAAETARLNVVAGSGYVAGSPANATVTITENGFLVTTTNDSGTGSLRQAILNANSIPGTDTITFSDGTGGTVNFTDTTADTITLTSGNLPITDAVAISGTGAKKVSVSGGGTIQIFNVSNPSGMVLIKGLRLTNGYTISGNPGGAIRNTGTVKVIECELSANTSFNSTGGAIYNTGSLVVVGSSIHGNVASQGAAIYSQTTQSAELNNVTISGNNAIGGALYANGGTFRISSSTITSNTLGLRILNNPSVTLSNTIIAGNTTDINYGSSASPITSEGYNLIGNTTGVTIDGNTTGNLTGTNASPLNPQLAALADNGGPTQTHALLAGSPALNAGLAANLPADTFDLDGDTNTTEPIPFDQRGTGFSRTVGTVDIGAFELQKSVSISNLAAISEGNSGTTNFVFTISRTGDTSGPVSMTYTVSGAAVNGTDFVGGTLPTGTATITAGNATGTVTIPVQGDTTVEPNEAFTVTLSSPDNGYVVLGAPATSTINNDDSATVGIAKITDGAESNSPTPGKFRVSQTAASSTDTTVSYSVSGTATSGTDFTSLSGSVTIPAGQTTADIDVTVLNDGLLEPTETVILSLISVTSTNAVTPGTPTSATMDVTDDDTATVTIAKITDGAETGPTNAVFRVTQTAQSTVDTTITYTTGGTAGITDFTAPSGSVTIPAGQTTADISVAITNDTIVEATETISLTLTGFTARDPDVSLGTTLLAIANITDNDIATVTIAKISDGGEPAANGLFRVTQTALSSTDTTLTYAVTGTATSGGDFTALSGSVTIPAGQTTADITVTVNNDAIVEATETVIATLNGFSTRDADISLGSTLSATVNITDEDTATVTLAKITDGVEAASPTNALFRVTQTAAASTDTVITYSVGGTATSGSDFTALSGSLTILAGQTTADISVAVLNENIVEATESVSLTLTGFTARDPDVTLGATLTASANITDSDTASVTVAKITDGAESGTSALFRVTQTAASSVDTVITYTTGGTAGSSDFTAPSGSVTIPAGLTTADVSVTITNDSLVEPTETLSLTLTGFTARDPDVSLGSTILASADLIDNDSAIVSVTKLTDGAESNTPTAGSFRISQSALSSVDTVVNLSITGSATSGSDFTALPASATIPANQSFVDVPVTVLNDNIIETTETVTMTLASLGAHNIGVTIASGAAPSLPPGVEQAVPIFSNTATLNITDNDVASSIAVNSGSNQGATVNTAFAGALVAIVKDSGGVALQGASVTFTAPGSGASGAFGSSATVLTDSAGLATAPTFTANTISGGYTVTAATSGVTPSASFSLTNNPGAATRYVVSAPGSAIAGVPVNVSVTAQDAFNNTATGYTGTVRITSSDTAAILPSNSTLVSGTKTFSVSFSTGGNQTVTATDTVSSGITGTSGTVAVSPRADLTVTLSDSPDPVSALGNLTYTIGLTNNGPSTSVAPVVTLPLPAFTTFVSASGPSGWTPTTPAVGINGTVSFTAASLASGGTASFTVVAKVALDVVNNSTLSATVTATETTIDPVDNNSATATTTARSGADRVATLTASPEPVVAGTELTYNLQLQNNGPLAADNAALSLPLPAGTTFVSLGSNSGWSATTPAVGDTGTVSITNSLFAPGTVSFPLVVKVGSNVLTGSVLNATLTSSSTTIDVAPGNESANVSSNVITRADLALDLSGTPTTAPKGSDVVFTLALTNNGPSDAVNPSVSFPIPAQMTFATAAAPSGWSISSPAIGSGGTVTFTRSGLVNGGSATFTVAAKVRTSAPNGTVIEATATASATGTDPVTPNNSDLTTAAVGTTTPTPLQLGTAAAFNRQNGMYDLTVNVTNTTPLPINGFRLHVNFASYIASFPSLRLYNASSAPGSSDVYVDYPYPVAVDGTIPVKLTFYTSSRTFPNPFSPILSVETLATSAVSDTNGSGVQPRLVVLPDHDVMLEFDSVPGRWYRVRYSHDLVHWFDCPVPIQAANNRMQWIDSGAPFTISPPSSVPSRYYRVNEIIAH